MRKDFSNINGDLIADMAATIERIGKLISESGLSDKELSSMMGLKTQTINKWRHGIGLPDVENLFIM